MKVRIGGQLAILLGIPLALLVVITVTATLFFASVAAANQKQVETLKLRVHVHDIGAQIYSQRFWNRGYFLTGNRQNLATAAVFARKAKADLAYAADHAALVDGVEPAVATVSAQFDRVASHSKSLLAASIKRRQDVLDAYAGVHTPAADAVAATLRAQASDTDLLNRDVDALASLVAGKADVGGEHIGATIAMAEAAIPTLGIVAIVLSIIAGVVLTISLRSRLIAVSTALREIVDVDFSTLGDVLSAVARGDMTRRYASARTALPARGSDEITDLTTSYNLLAEGLSTVAARTNDSIENLSRALGHVSETATHLMIASKQVSLASGQSAAAVHQIATSVDKVALGASAQAESLTTTGSALEELARSAQQIAEGTQLQAFAMESAVGAVRKLDTDIVALADHGRTLATSAKSADAQASGGSTAVDETASAMRSLHERTLTAQSAMTELEERSIAVGEIVSTIEEIADQTNLLALNAAIEAARAGEHGRGFAVVADEVRKLAERSSQATREISNILGAIRRETLSAGEALRASASSMNDGLSLAQRAASALTSVGDAISSTNRVAGELAERGEYMQQASSQLAESIDSASAIVGENASSASEMRTTTDAIARTVIPLMQTAQEQSAASQDVSAATSQLAASVQELDATARELEEQAERLRGVVSMFRIEVLPAPEALLAIA